MYTDFIEWVQDQGAWGPIIAALAGVDEGFLLLSPRQSSFIRRILIGTVDCIK